MLLKVDLLKVRTSDPFHYNTNAIHILATNRLKATKFSELIKAMIEDNMTQIEFSS